MNFHKYGVPWDSHSTMTFAEVIRLAREGDLLARAEESGEGCCVEIARWQYLADDHGSITCGEWRRFAYIRFLGGEGAEFGVADPKAHPREIADHVALVINMQHA